MKKYYVLAGIVVIGCLALGASSLKSSMTPYVQDFAQVRAGDSEDVQMVGSVVRGKTTFNREKSELIFFLSDDKGDEMKVVYGGTKPGNFDQADKVVAIGRYGDGVFKAERLLVKCPSKYQNK